MAARWQFPARLAPWLVLASSLLVTLAAAGSVMVAARARDDARFRNAVQAAHDRVLGRLDIYISTLRGGAALLAADDAITEQEFRSYVERLEIQQRYPGIQGFGYTARTATGLSGDIDERYSIVYLEPQDTRNRAAMGFDMYSEAERRDAMQRARDLGEPAMSGPVVLMQEIYEHDEQRGFLIYLPVYRDHAIPPTLEQRREQLVGFVYAPFRADDLFAGIFGSEQFPRVSFAVYDTHDEGAAALLHRSPRALNHVPEQRTRVPLEVGGRRWTVEYFSQPEFEAGSGSFIVPAVVAAGMLFSAWLFWLSWRLARERLAADDANRAKSAFLASMSHELRTPLNAIAGYVDLLLLGIPHAVTPAQKDYLLRVQRAQQHLLGLINDVLNFAKLEAGRVEYHVEDVSVATIVDQALEMMMPAAAARGLQCSVEPGSPVHVRADAEKARQVVLNLMSNAVKFTDRGGSVHVSWRTAGSMCEIAVCDTGVGIDASQHERIFDPFVQVDADLTRERQGTGLGLSISRALARGMHGDIMVRSERARGSTFLFALPLAQS